jgi:Helicase associated domain
LGSWVAWQRAKKDTLSLDQVQRLNLLDFSWDPRSEFWEPQFTALHKFRQREGHCRVPGDHQEDGLKLGDWVSNLRQKKDKLPADQVERLNQLGFVWDARS